MTARTRRAFIYSAKASVVLAVYLVLGSRHWIFL